MDKQTMIMTYEYDENKESMAETFGLNADEAAVFVSNCFNGGYDSATAALMAELPKQEKAGSLLLLLASAQLQTMQKEMVCQMLTSILGGEMDDE